MKGGFAGDNLPRFVIPTLVGRPVLRAEEVALNADVAAAAAAAAASPSGVLVGARAAAARAALELSCPLEGGVVRSWPDMDALWSEAFYAPGCGGLPRGGLGARRALLTEPPSNPRAARARTLAGLFEAHGWGGVQLAPTATLALYASGLLTGLVVDAGAAGTAVTPVADGYVLAHAAARLPVGGRAVSRALADALLRRGVPLSHRTADAPSVDEMKERLCYVAADAPRERRLAEETTALTERYALPDGRVVALGRERFEAPEVLFAPAGAGLEGPGLARAVFDAVNRADVDVRAGLYRAVLLAGGGSMLPGLSTRLEAELRGLYAERVAREIKIVIKVLDPPRRAHSVFVGAAVLAEIMAAREDYWLSKAMYEEEGAERLADRLGGAPR